MSKNVLIISSSPRKGGNPERFANNYEALQLMFHPFIMSLSANQS